MTQHAKNNKPTDLPTPSRDALAHSDRLCRFIRGDIAKQGGVIDFARYMQHALYAPGLGYYTAGASKFGQQGDFITAPEISPLFGRSVARQCADVLKSLNSGDVLEVGAGSGKLARDILLELKQLDCLPDRYLILESSADLRQRQQQLLQAEMPDFFSKIAWLDSWPEQPFSGVVVANELLDAMPVHRLMCTDEGWVELGVGLENDDFCWSALNDKTKPVASLTQQLQEANLILDQGYISEICLAQKAWVNSLANCLQHALILLIDYGYSRKDYYHPQRRNGSLRCHYRHYAHDDPFFYPGLQDITAHVDFTAIAEAAVEYQLDVLGYTTQAYFLMACGITELVDMDSLDELSQVEHAQQIRRLTMPGEMGESFKVIALGKNLDLDLRGFSFNDQRGHL